MTPEKLLAPQPPTVPGEDQRPVWHLIIMDLDAGSYEHAQPGGERWAFLGGLFHERDKQGERKYGVRLPVDSGRNSRVDELQEALDGMVYSRQTFERESRLESALAVAQMSEFNHAAYKAAQRRAARAWERHLRCLQAVVELLEELS